ncbi:MAG: carboxymethylenebutenolidase [Myxococcota bacterium]|jgi:carboxymethylenebutenolidase
MSEPVLESLTLELPDGPLPATLARPHAPTGGGVVVIHDITGFRADTLRHLRHLADAGLTAIAPDLFGRYRIGCVVKTLASMVTGRGFALTAIEAARAALVERAEVDADRIGVMGFCMGGGFALLSAADGEFAVCAPFYGPVPPKAERLRGICPVIAGFGGQDMLFASHAARLERHLTALGVPHIVRLHPEAGHSFMNDHPDPLFALARYTPVRSRYLPELEAESFWEMLGFFAEHGV